MIQTSSFPASEASPVAPAVGHVSSESAVEATVAASAEGNCIVHRPRLTESDPAGNDTSSLRPSPNWIGHRPTKAAPSEEWRPVVGYEGYEVSNLGNVRSFKRGRVRLMCRHAHYLGYVRVLFCSNGKQKHKYVHRLVAAAFIGPCEPGHEIDHIDGDKQNCAAWNLEYVTRSENILRAFRNGQCKPMRGSAASRSKLTEAQAIEIASLPHVDSRGVSVRYGVSKSAVDNIWIGKNWGHVTGLAYVPAKKTHFCSTCGTSGHNARTCTRRAA